MNKAIFLDRDGVINKSHVIGGKPCPPQTFDEFEIYEDVLEALTIFKNEGFMNIIVTNQPDVATGKQKMEVVEKMHSYLLQHLPIDHIEGCYAIEGEDEGFYKPGPGMLFKASLLFNLDLSLSYMIGDRWRDVGAGQNARCKRSILIDRSYGEENPYKPDYQCFSLLEACHYILQQERIGSSNF